MKKLLLFIVITVFIMSPTFSQDDGGTSTQGISFGAKAGVNFASITGDIEGEDVDEFEGRTGLHIGAVVNIPISDMFAVQPEVIYSQQGFTEEIMGYEIKGIFNFINVPILADVTVAEGFSLQAGPQVGFTMTSEIETPDGTEDIKDDQESVIFDAAVGAQYRLPIGLFFQARYTFGLSNVSTDPDADVKNSVISISAGWFFN